MMERACHVFQDQYVPHSSRGIVFYSDKFSSTCIHLHIILVFVIHHLALSQEAFISFNVIHFDSVNPGDGGRET
jgi:hypothetical protein